MRLVADFHVHSRFARACSKRLTLPNMAAWAAVKGIDLIGTADFTHPVWLSEIHRDLVEAGEGIYELKTPAELPFPVADPRPVRFILTHEVATIWGQGGKLRRMHTILIAPDLAAADGLTAALEPRGKLGSDGRPVLGMSARELAEICWSVDERILVIPAHAWTPWFAVFGSQSGFDSLEECFGADLVGRIPAIETGMSSNPPMNWQLSALDTVALLSCSDGHSLDNLGREATIFEVADPAALSFDLVARMIRAGSPKARAVARPGADYLWGTIEFFPEEGKYHHDGHRACGVNWTPEERKRHDGVCPVCGRPVTVGVLSRVDDLADRPLGYTPDGAPEFLQIVPIRDILSSLLGVGKQSKRIDHAYRQLIASLGPEFQLLLEAPTERIAAAGTDEFAAVVEAMRAGNVTMAAGYDGVYGTLQLPKRREALQHSLFQKATA